MTQDLVPPDPAHPERQGGPRSDPASSTDVPEAPKTRRAWPWALLVVVVVVAVIVAFTNVGVFPAIVAVVAALVIMRVGWFFLAQFATPPPPPPEPGTLRRVRLTYRCPTCSTEVRMTSAATEDPEPPRHCMEDMELVSSEE